MPRTFANAGAGFLVEDVGWFGFFVACGVLGLPGLLLLPKVAPWRQDGGPVRPPEAVR